MSKLKMPEPKQTNPEIVDNYYWEINMARRRQKMTINQLSVQISVPVEILESIEKGQIPSDYLNIFSKLEQYFRINLLKKHEQKISFNYNPNEEQRILEDVKNKLSNSDIKNKEFDSLNKREQLRKIKKGEVDFSKEQEIKNITLNDLVELKRKKDKEEQRRKVQRQTEEMFGDDIELA